MLAGIESTPCHFWYSKFQMNLVSEFTEASLNRLREIRSFGPRFSDLLHIYHCQNLLFTHSKAKLPEIELDTASSSRTNYNMQRSLVERGRISYARTDSKSVEELNSIHFHDVRYADPSTTSQWVTACAPQQKTKSSNNFLSLFIEN